jgi:hypothetical protein
MVVDHITMEVMATIMKTTIAVTVDIDMAGMGKQKQARKNQSNTMTGVLFLMVS